MILDEFRFDRTRFAAHVARLQRMPFSPAMSHLNGPFRPLEAERYVAAPDPRFAKLGSDALARGEVAFVLLNGGMATRFGGVAKGAAKALGEHSFLALRMRQARAVAPGAICVLMSSFATDAATRAHLEQHRWFGFDPAHVMICLQGIDQRLTETGDLFLDEHGEPSYYAPGHGDLPWALDESGVAAKLRERGVKTLFVSNVDNLGCTLDPAVLGTFLQTGTELGVECCAREAKDVGGAPIYVDGELQLCEGFRLPPSFDQSVLTGFNTNTFYLTWRAADPSIAQKLEFHPVAKTVNGHKVVQFERILGELTRHVSTAYLRVPRDAEHGRFLPVKAPEDLVALQPMLAKRYRF